MGVVIRQSIKGTLVTYIGAFIGFLSTMFVATEFLEAEEIGLMRILTEAAVMLSSLAQLGTSRLGIRFFPYFKSEDGKHHGFFMYLCVFPVLGIVFFFTLYTILKNPIASYFQENSTLFVDYYFYVLPLAAFMIYQTITETYSNALMRIVVPKFVREILIRVLYIGCILLYAFDIINLNGFVLSFVLIYLVASLVNIGYIVHLKQYSFKVDRSFITPALRKNMIQYGLYLMVASIAGILSLKLDIFMISSELGLASTGIYSIAYYMAVIIEIPSRSISAITQPMVSQSLKENDLKSTQSYYQQIGLNQFLIGAFIFLLLWINTDVIFDYMPNGSLYAQGKYVVLFIGISKLIEMILNFNQIILSYSRYYAYTLICTVVYGGMIILGNLWMIPLFGISGAALATLAVTLVYQLLLTFFVWYKVKVHPFSWKLLWITAIICASYFLQLLIPDVHGNSKFLCDLCNACTHTFTAVGLSFLCIYRLKISPPMNSVTDGILRKAFRKKQS